MNLIFLRKKIRIRSRVNFRRKHILSDCLFIILCYFVLYLPPIHLILYFFVSLPAFETKKLHLYVSIKNFTYYPSMATSVSLTPSASVCLSACLSLSLCLPLTRSLRLTRTMTTTLSVSISLTHSHTLSLSHTHSLTCFIIPTLSLSFLSFSSTHSLSPPFSLHIRHGPFCEETNVGCDNSGQREKKRCAHNSLYGGDHRVYSS